jgi:hypothetical protein
VKTTKRDFGIFKEECQLWLEFYGINKIWDIGYGHSNFEDGSEACCMSDPVNRSAKLILDIEIEDTKYSEYYIQECAFHEVHELMLAHLRGIAQWRTFDSDTLNEAVHEVININQNTVFKQFRKYVIGSAKKEKGRRIKR